MTKKEVHKEGSFFSRIRKVQKLEKPWSHCAKGLSCDDLVFFCGYIYFLYWIRRGETISLAIGTWDESSF
jgi:hypothetical protein